MYDVIRELTKKYPPCTTELVREDNPNHGWRVVVERTLPKGKFPKAPVARIIVPFNVERLEMEADPTAYVLGRVEKALQEVSQAKL